MDEKKNYTVPLVVMTTLFFMWGFLTVMNDILIPHLKKVFELNYFEAMLVQFAFFGAYFVGSLIYFFISSTTGDPINKIGYKNGIILGIFIAAIGTLLFYPAAEFSSYGFFLTALFILGLGFTMLQIAANPYVAILGEEKTAASRLNLAQALNSVGTTIAPLVGGFLIFTYFANKSGIAEAQAVKIPYLIFTGVLVLLGVLIWVWRLPEFTNKTVIEKGAAALKYPQLVFGIIAIFLYVGAEVSIGSIMINFIGLPEIAGLKEESAKEFVSFYWGGLMIGRFMGSISLSNMKKNNKLFLTLLVPVLAFLIILYLKGIDIALIYSIFLVLSLTAFFIGKSLPARTTFIFSLFAVTLLIISIFTTGYVALWTVIGIGIFNSVMWSNIFTLSISGLGRHTSQGSSLLVMAILGGAVLPVLQGAAADAFGVHNSFFVPILSYVYIAIYGLKLYKPKHPQL